MYKHNGKWARRQGIECYRVYDRDVPGFPLAIDVYGDAVYVSLYHGRHILHDDLSVDEWLIKCVSIIAEVLQREVDRIFLKQRQQQKGLQQYEKLDDQSYTFTVREDGLSFIVNMTDYLDTGLFLDHRNTRKMVREMAEGKRVLNLFAYTGSFSVYAAAGGAAAVTTVDLSNTYLKWARQNMQINGFSADAYEFVQTDVKAFLLSPSHSKYDIVILDPPTFSNSKRMKDVLDVQRDHASLINLCLKICNPGGLIFFSTNYRGFTLDDHSIASKAIKEITQQTIPRDFRDKTIHRCFIIESG